MKQIKLTVLLTVLMSMVGAKAVAHDIEVANADGVTIYYNFINNNTELEVTVGSKYYLDDIVIPDEVTYGGKIYSVTMIVVGLFINQIIKQARDQRTSLAYR